MAIILASLLKYSTYDGESEIPVALDDENGILTDISRYLPRSGGRIVLVANRPDDPGGNDAKLDIIRESFALGGFDLERADVLDDRNAIAARQLIDRAQLVILRGGKCLCQNAFLRAIGLREILNTHRGLTVGVSAGAMNLCSTVANFPEELGDIDEPRFFDGLGLYEGSIIPHFDGEKCAYQFDCGDFDVAREYILPMSRERELTAIPNGSYIMLEHGKTTVHGTAYTVNNGVIARVR